MFYYIYLIVYRAWHVITLMNSNYLFLFANHSPPVEIMSNTMPLREYTVTHSVDFSKPQIREYSEL